MVLWQCGAQVYSHCCWDLTPSPPCLASPNDFLYTQELWAKNAFSQKLKILNEKKAVKIFQKFNEKKPEMLHTVFFFFISLQSSKLTFSSFSYVLLLTYIWKKSAVLGPLIIISHLCLGLYFVHSCFQEVNVTASVYFLFEIINNEELAI